VIDASVARASGYQEEMASRSRTCSDFLMAVYEFKHKLVMTEEISAEWEKHASRFAKRWKASMIAKKQFVYIIPQKRNDLFQKLKMIFPSNTICTEIDKDMRLLEAAMSTDRLIASLDDEIRKIFAKSSKTVQEISNIEWVNPEKDDEKTLEWLKTGAKPEKKRMLVNFT
jgi:hypothetical protein